LEDVAMDYWACIAQFVTDMEDDTGDESNLMHRRNRLID